MGGLGGLSNFIIFYKPQKFWRCPRSEDTPLHSSPLVPSFPPESRGSSSTLRVSNGLERHKGTACRVRFLPRSHSSAPPRDQGGMKFICLRGFGGKSAGLNAGRFGAPLKSTLCIIDRGLVLRLMLTGAFSVPPPPHSPQHSLTDHMTSTKH